MKILIHPILVQQKCLIYTRFPSKFLQSRRLGPNFRSRNPFLEFWLFWASLIRRILSIPNTTPISIVLKSRNPDLQIRQIQNPKNLLMTIRHDQRRELPQRMVHVILCGPEKLYVLLTYVSLISANCLF